jgi:4-hydroxybenzoate polyprenyltransferase
VAAAARLPRRGGFIDPPGAARHNVAAKEARMAYVRLLRPQQWIKNLFVFAGLVFGGKLLDASAVVAAVLGFFCLSLVSSHIYVLNDIHDRQEDLLHPRKRLRPIAAGLVSVPAALAVAVVLLVLGLGGAFWLDRGFFLCAAAYLVLQFAYTGWLKHAVILDVISIALGFVLRAVAGAVLVHVLISPWLVICTFTLCLFMGFSKRRCELNTLAQNGGAGQHRRTLAVYTPDLLNHMTTVTAGIAIISFMLYASDPKTIAKFHTDYLLYTLPLVVYAVFRFAVLVEHGRVDGPTDVLLRDRPFQAAVLAWALAAGLIVYRGEELRAWLEGLATAQGLTP